MYVENDLFHVAPKTGLCFLVVLKVRHQGEGSPA